MAEDRVGVEPRLLTLEGIADRAAAELFQHAVEQVLENMIDPNTDPKKARTIALKFTFEPTEDSKAADVTVECATKIAGIRPQMTRVYVGRHEGRTVAAEPQPQQSMFPSPDARPSLVTGGA